MRIINKHSVLIQEMKEFCKSKNIKYFCDFLDYCADYNLDWYNELLNCKQVFRYMEKYLTFDMPLYDDNYEEGTDKDFDTHFVDVQNGNGYYDEDGIYRSYGCSDENF